MRNFKIVVAYDGTDFHGWQIQPKKETVTSCLQDTFQKVFDQKINLIGASRTDSGVHALGQVAKFKSDIDLNFTKILYAWNNKLPPSILIRKLEETDKNFHPHNNVYQKTYLYHLFFKRPLPFVARFGWFYYLMRNVDLQKFDKALQLYIGEHDFASFCKIEQPDKSTVRTIDSISINKISKFGTLQIVIKGKSFLRFQIRRMIGYALDVARRPDLSLDYLKEMLNKPNPQQTLLKAEACGLCLRKVTYKNE